MGRSFEHVKKKRKKEKKGKRKKEKRKSTDDFFFPPLTFVMKERFLVLTEMYTLILNPINEREKKKKK